MLILKGKTDAVREWAKQWDGFNGYLKLNALIAKEDERTIITEPSDVVIERYIDGTAKRMYGFNLRMVLPWSDGYDSTNRDSLAVAVQLYDWAVEQNANRNYPDWDGALITSLEPTQSMPSVNFIYEEEGLAEYLIPFVINYEE